MKIDRQIGILSVLLQKRKALFEQDCKWRLVDEFGTESFRVQQDGRLLFQADSTDKDSLITWLLSFGEKAELLEPQEIREEIGVIVECMKKKYEGGSQKP